MVGFELEIKSFDSYRYQEVIDALRENGLVFQEKESRKDFIIDYSGNSHDEGRRVVGGYLNVYGDKIVVQIFLRNSHYKPTGSKSLKEVIDCL